MLLCNIDYFLILVNKVIIYCIGLTDGVMLDRKTLSDLIKPWETRRQKLIDFICDIAHFQPLNVRYDRIANHGCFFLIVYIF